MSLFGSLKLYVSVKGDDCSLSSMLEEDLVVVVVVVEVLSGGRRLLQFACMSTLQIATMNYQ